MRLDGEVDPAALRGALDGLQQRHPLLRAAVETDARGRKPRFAEQPAREIPLRIVASAAGDLDDTWEEELRQTLLRTAFDFASGAFLSAVLVSDAGGEVHDLVFVAPCLVVDADGVLGLQRECLALLAAAGGGGERVGGVADGAARGARGTWVPARDVVVPGLEELFPRSAKGLRGMVRAARGALIIQSSMPTARQRSCSSRMALAVAPMIGWRQPSKRSSVASW